MNFKFKILRLANLYFFIRNLSEWHFSCNKKYNEIWEKELGKFSEKEKRAIKEFKKIHLNYPYIISEITNCSLFPTGILVKKIIQYSHIPLRTDISEKYTEKILEISEKYILENKLFDNVFANKIYKIVKEMEKKKDIIPSV